MWSSSTRRSPRRFQMIVPSTKRCEGCFAIASPPLAQLPVQHGRAASGVPVNDALGSDGEVKMAQQQEILDVLRARGALSKDEIVKTWGLSEPE